MTHPMVPLSSQLTDLLGDFGRRDDSTAVPSLSQSAVLFGQASFISSSPLPAVLLVLSQKGVAE